MISFVKFAAVLSTVCLATAALSAKSDDASTPKPEAKESGSRKSKKGQPQPEETPKKKTMDVPVTKGHDSKGLSIPYFDGTGKRQMNFKIGVASRLDDNHIAMQDLHVETFDEDGAHDMAFVIPTSIFDTDTSQITSKTHSTIRRADFELTGETLIFNTRTKQGGLGGNVRMVIYNLDDETGEADAKAALKKTEESKKTDGSKESTPKPALNTPQPKAK